MASRHVQDEFIGQRLFVQKDHSKYFEVQSTPDIDRRGIIRDGSRKRGLRYGRGRARITTRYELAIRFGTGMFVTRYHKGYEEVRGDAKIMQVSKDGKA